MLYPARCEKCGEVEIEKPMAADFPRRHTCGHILHRVFVPLSVHYAAAGFYSTDVNRLKSLVGSDRYARFEHERDAARQRGKAGTLTPYERQLERV